MIRVLDHLLMLRYDTIIIFDSRSILLEKILALRRGDGVKILALRMSVVRD